MMDGFYCVLWPRNDCLFLQDIKENDLGWAAARPYLLAQRNTHCHCARFWKWCGAILFKVDPLSCTFTKCNVKFGVLLAEHNSE